MKNDSRPKFAALFALFLRRVFLVDLLSGLAVTFRNQSPKKVYTEQYPLERPQVAERYRGLPRLAINPDDGKTLCIACDLCAKNCPEHLITVESERDPVTKRKVLTKYTFDISRCMFCGICEESCSTDAIELTQDFEIAQFSRDGVVWDRKRLEQGPDKPEYSR